MEKKKTLIRAQCSPRSILGSPGLYLGVPRLTHPIRHSFRWRKQLGWEAHALLFVGSYMALPQLAVRHQASYLTSLCFSLVISENSDDASEHFGLLSGELE